MVGFEKALRAVEVVKDQIQYRSHSLFNLARDYFIIFSTDMKHYCRTKISRRSAVIFQANVVVYQARFFYSICQYKIRKNEPEMFLKIRSMILCDYDTDFPVYSTAKNQLKIANKIFVKLNRNVYIQAINALLTC